MRLPYTVRRIHPCRPGSPSSFAGDSPLALRSPILRGALVLAAIACLLPAASRGATLDVIGPPGAEIVLEGEVLGILPLAEPIELPHGRLLLIYVRKPGHITHEEQVFLERVETEKTVEVELLALSRGTAVAISALLAGSGQFYQGRKTAGWIQLSLQATAWGSAIYGELVFKDKRDEYESLDQQYQDALVPSEIERLRAERDEKWNELKDAESWRNWSLAAVAAIAAYSAFDAWRGHNRFFASVQSPAESADGTTTAQVGLKWAFGGGVR